MQWNTLTWRCKYFYTLVPCRFHHVQQWRWFIQEHMHAFTFHKRNKSWTHVLSCWPAISFISVLISHFRCMVCCHNYVMLQWMAENLTLQWCMHGGLWSTSMTSVHQIDVIIGHVIASHVIMVMCMISGHWLLVILYVITYQPVYF